ncbi:hypothetical protein K466DRAFT_656772 [Polyporus arcularius HHB13444]|uniref:Peptidase A1 domain-containing protein n=1 Tax=Polyporus arcularius HHB13444 TaxID=1314778 RepID=A0A5C3NR46_9APHY|nr:hypothetical protein K466DRAFT_656772 [Polyporus arcularius HHB13444]
MAAGTPPISYNVILGTGSSCVLSPSRLALFLAFALSADARDLAANDGLSASQSDGIPTSEANAPVDVMSTEVFIGNPADSISALYAQIPGSEAFTGDNAGYYTFPCNTNVTVTMNFGKRSIVWPILNADFLLMQNVYSIFRASPAAVGFAQLSSTATSMNGQLGSLPSPTVGSVATVTGGSANAGSDRNSNADAPLRVDFTSLGLWLAMFLSGIVGGGLLL